MEIFKVFIAIYLHTNRVLTEYNFINYKYYLIVRNNNCCIIIYYEIQFFQ